MIRCVSIVDDSIDIPTIEELAQEIRDLDHDDFVVIFENIPPLKDLIKIIPRSLPLLDAIYQKCENVHLGYTDVFRRYLDCDQLLNRILWWIALTQQQQNQAAILENSKTGSENSQNEVAETHIKSILGVIQRKNPEIIQEIFLEKSQLFSSLEALGCHGLINCSSGMVKLIDAVFYEVIKYQERLKLTISKVKDMQKQKLISFKESPNKASHQRQLSLKLSEVYDRLKQNEAIEGIILETLSNPKLESLLRITKKRVQADRTLINIFNSYNNTKPDGFQICEVNPVVAKVIVVFQNAYKQLTSLVPVSNNPNDEGEATADILNDETITDESIVDRASDDSLNIPDICLPNTELQNPSGVISTNPRWITLSIYSSPEEVQDLITRFSNLYYLQKDEILKTLNALAEFKGLKELQIKTMLSAVVLTYRSVYESTQAQYHQIYSTLQTDNEFDDIMDYSLYRIMYRQAKNNHGIKNAKDVTSQIWKTLFDFPSLKTCTRFNRFILDCVDVVWDLVAGIDGRMPRIRLDYDCQVAFDSTRHLRVPDSSIDNSQLRANDIFSKISYGSDCCHILKINSTNDADLPDPWQQILEHKYRGLETGLEMARKKIIEKTASADSLASDSSKPSSLVPMSTPSSSISPVFSTSSAAANPTVPLSAHYPIGALSNQITSSGGVSPGSQAFSISSLSQRHSHGQCLSTSDREQHSQIKRLNKAVIEENAPPPQDEDAFDLNDMIEEVDPSTLIGLDRKKSFKRKLPEVSVEPPKKKGKKQPENLKPEVAVAESKKKKKVKKPKKLKKPKPPAVEEKIVESSSEDEENVPRKGKKPGVHDPETVNLDMSSWSSFFLPNEVLEGLRKMKYTKPTPIQEMTLPVAILKRQDVLGAAETGSGKTMAFCIPIATRLMETERKDNLRALILAPTRELVVQIYKEMEKLLEFTPFSVIPVVGGLSQQKQERLLNRKPAVIVATPGRFWTLMETTDYLQDLQALNFLVIDEIDRMVETGHFAEMEMILAKIHAVENKALQTLVFSATLSFVHIPVNRPGKQALRLTREQKIEKLVQIGGLRKQHKVIDLNESTATPATLVEARMNCNDLLDKDSKVYYLLKRYSGRTLIFTNSIDASRRLHNLLKVMDLEPELLHAKMQQRARIKHLERFSSKDNSILIATDVAARGLDIKGIENVIHYQIPRSAENYIHRSGRTARISNKGVAILLVDPTEVNLYRKLCHNLHKTADFPVFDIDNQAMYSSAIERMHAATRVEQLEHRISKMTARKAWENKAADEAEIVVEKLSEEQTEELHSFYREKKAATKALKTLLRQPLGNGKDTTVATPITQPPLTQRHTTKLLRKRKR